ncbi:hypothetical protein [Streptomyces beijiangensis]|uniref:Uncharacterized protein n=1 Tax=Streptomyces beijiangensis TaxID=163361 RepID=A0A939F3J5_9ACTN|nr:hypothetical protein [Streptomyces beijiangensis]MBO0510432.1 hypothetical protein [Streptomyces beijiangensis]
MGVKIRSRLERVCGEHRAVFIERRRLDADRTIGGFVLETNQDWTLMAPLTGLAPDGWIALRTADVTEVSVKGERDVAMRWLKHKGTWPAQPPSDGFPLTDARSIIEAVSDRWGLVGLSHEADDMDCLHIGAVERAAPKKVRLRELDAKTRWAVRATKLRYADITRIDFNDAYMTALGTLAEPAPGQLYRHRAVSGSTATVHVIAKGTGTHGSTGTADGR